MYVYIAIVITAPTSPSQATPSLMVDKFTTTTQAFTATSTSGLVNGKLNCVSFVEILSCYDLYEYMFKFTMTLDSCVLSPVLKILLRAGPIAAGEGLVKIA